MRYSKNIMQTKLGKALNAIHTLENGSLSQFWRYHMAMHPRLFPLVKSEIQHHKSGTIQKQIWEAFVPFLQKSTRVMPTLEEFRSQLSMGPEELKHAMRDLLKSSRQYLRIQSLESMPLARARVQVFVSQRAYPELAIGEIQDYQKMLDKGYEGLGSYFQECFSIEKAWLREGRIPQNSTTPFDRLIHLHRSSLLHQELRLSALARDYCFHSKTPYSDARRIQICNAVHEHVDDHPLIAFYLHVHALFHLREHQAVDEAFLNALSQVLDVWMAVMPFLDGEELYDSFGLLSNTYVWLLNIGVQEVGYELNQLFDVGETRGIITLSPSLIKNRLQWKCQTDDVENVRQYWDKIRLGDLVLSRALTDYCEALVRWSEFNAGKIDSSKLESLFKLLPVDSYPRRELSQFLIEAMRTLRIKVFLVLGRLDDAHTELKKLTSLDPKRFKQVQNRIRFLRQFISIPVADIAGYRRLRIEIQQELGLPASKRTSIDNVSWLLGMIEKKCGPE